MLTLDELKAKPHGTILGAGKIENHMLHEDPVKWVAKVGDGFHDWAIYYHPHFSIENVCLHGEKITTEAIIRSLVPCDDEVFKLYRF